MIAINRKGIAMGFLGTVWGHLLVQVVIGAGSAAVQYATGHDFGAYNGLVQGVAAMGAELVALGKTTK